MKNHEYFVYILTNKKYGTLYTGVTSNLEQRIRAHKQKQIEGFTKKYSLNQLVYYEVFNYIDQAIHREKQIKHYKREYKYNLIEKQNPSWQDLAENLIEIQLSNFEPKLKQASAWIPGQARDDKGVIYLGLGANLPWQNQLPVATLEQAIAVLPQHNIHVQTVSPFYQSPPWLGMEQPDYINAVVAVKTVLLPAEVMEAIIAIETQFGRQRSVKNASRTLDIDIIAWGNKIIQNEMLTVPHPYLAERAFVLLPLHDIAPEWQHPQKGQTIKQLIAACADCTNIQKI